MRALKVKKTVQPNPSIPPPSPEDGAIELSAILDAKAIQSMIEAFFALEHIGMAIADRHGKILVAAGWQDICTKFHRVHPEACRHCQESDIALSQGVAPGEFKLYRCQNNLWGMATPIVVGGRHVGNFFLGQFFFDDEPPDMEFFRAQARRYGFDEADYLAALDRVPRWSREKIDRAMAFSARLATQISELGYRNLQLTQALAAQKRAEEALQRSETRYRTFINATSDLVFLKDEAFRYLISNRANSAFLGRAEEDVTGRTDFDLMPREAAERCRASDQEALRQGTSVVSEETVDGQVYQTVKFPVSLPDGRTGVGGFVRDVTEQKQAEEALRKSETQLSNALEMTHAGHWEYDVASGMFTFNDNFYRIFRTTAEQMGGYRMAAAEYARRFCHPDDMAIVADETRQALESADPGYNRQFEHRIRYADGTTGSIAVRFFIVKDPQGRTVKTYGVNQDITERKQVEEALRESEALYRSILNASPDNVTLADLEGRILMVSPSALAMLGCQRADQLVGQMVFDFLVPEDRERAAADMARMFQDPKPSTDQYCALRVDGTRFAVEANGEFIRDAAGRPVRMLLVIRDVTARKRAEEAMRQSEEKFAQAFRISPYAITLTRVDDGRFIDVNAAFTAIFGYSHEEALADSSIGLGLWARRKDRQQVVGDLRKGNPVIGREYVFRAKSGRLVTCLFSAQALRLGDESCILSSISDISDRKQAEEALQDSEQRHRDYLAHSPYGIFVADEKGRFVQVNPAACRMTGYSEKELLAQSVPDLHGEEGREEAVRHFQAVLRDGKAIGELRFRTKSGEIRWWLVSAVKISDARLLGFCNDITDHKQAEEKLQASAERFRDIAANIPGAIYQLQTGRTGTLEVSYMSSGCEALFGRPLAGLDFTGLLFDHMHLGDRALFEHTLAKAAEQMKRWSLEFRIATPEGSAKWLRGSANPRQAPQGGVLWNGVLLDITELKQAEQSLREREAFQNLLMDTIPTPVFYKDRQGRYLGVNKAFETLYGMTKDQLVGKSAFDIAPPELAKIYHAKDVELCERPGTQVYEAPMRDAQGVLHDVVFHKASIVDTQGAVAGLIGIILDITQRKQAEEQMAKHLDELRRWQTVTLGREGRVAEMKREVNALSVRLGQPPPYPSAEETGPEPSPRKIAKDA